MMLFVHITSACDSRNDVMCTQHIIVMISKMMSCAHIAPGLRFEDFYSLHDIMVMIQETISYTHMTSGLLFHR